MSTPDECPALGSSHEMAAGSMSGHNAGAGTSTLKVPARSMSGPEVRRCVTATAVSAVIPGRGIGGQRQAAERQNRRENCGQRKD